MKPFHRIRIRRHGCGFFSDFLTSLAGIKYCYDNNIDFHVDWKSPLYPTLNDTNLFDEFFFQEKIEREPDFVYDNLTPYGYQFPDIWNESSDEKIYEFHKPFADLLTNLNLLNSPFINSIPKNIFQGMRVLGFHKRGTDHAAHGHILPDELVLQKIKEELNKNSYDKILMITDDLNSFNFFQKQFGNDLITTDCMRSSYNGVHLLQENPNRHLLAAQVVADAMLLSFTDKKLITMSNVAWFSCLCNLKPDNFIYMDKGIHYS
jgi:hypothetical protein